MRTPILLAAAIAAAIAMPAVSQDNPAPKPAATPAAPASPAPSASPAAPASPASPSSPAPAAKTAAAKPSQVVPIDRIVAIVNTEVITRRELDDRIRIATQQLHKQNVQLPEPAVLERQVLERMILDRAQLQFARDTGIRVDDLTLDRTIERIAENNHLSLPEFRQVLARDGIDFDRFREDIRGEITISRLREREVDNKVQVSESDVDDFLESQKATLTDATEYQVRHILIRVPEQATPDQIDRLRLRAAEAVRQLREGADFGRVAVSFSDAPDALQGGNLGWRNAARLPDLFTAALSHMKPGDISDVLRSPAGFHVIKLEGTRGGSSAMVVDQTHVRHILIRTNDQVSEAEAVRKLQILRARIKDGADFGELARLNSDDGSASRGGDLGWVYPGDTVPEFEHAMNALAVGQISQPVRTQFGVHLIQVLARRRADASADRLRLEARRVLRERRVDEAYQEWLRQLRDRTYVEYRLDDR